MARLDYQVLVRSPRIGRKGIVYIRDWLHQYGLTIAEPPPKPKQASPRREKQLINAVNVLRRNGFEVQIESLLKDRKADTRG